MLHTFDSVQWRIQYFPEGRVPPEVGANLLFGKSFAENSTKIEQIGQWGPAMVCMFSSDCMVLHKVLWLTLW